MTQVGMVQRKLYQVTWLLDTPGLELLPYYLLIFDELIYRSTHKYTFVKLIYMSRRIF